MCRGSKASLPGSKRSSKVSEVLLGALSEAKMKRMTALWRPKSAPKSPTSAKTSPKWSPKGIPKVSQNHQNGIQKASQKRAPKKHRKMFIFSTLKCGSSVVNTGKINEFQLLISTPFWDSFWSGSLRSQAFQRNR